MSDTATKRQCTEVKATLERALAEITEIDKASTVSTAYVIGIVKRNIANSIDETRVYINTDTDE